MPKLALAIIVAMDRHRLIGDHERIPWHLPEELQLFRSLTEGSSLIMGRKTFESIGRPLENRYNLVLSRTLPARQGIVVCRDLSRALAEVWRLERPVYFIGGSTVYQKVLAIVDQLHVSWIEGDFSGDCYFPEIDFGEWQPVGEQHGKGFRYVHYLRKKLVTQDSELRV